MRQKADALRFPGLRALTAWPSLWQCDLIKKVTEMSIPKPTKEEYDSLIYKLATLEGKMR